MSRQTKLNTIRIIAGRWRARRLPVLDSDGLRPTTDRVRETLFNWLMHQTQGATCLDLFAGSGALGLECLSRGAHFVQFVESDPRIVTNLKQNLMQLGVNFTEQNSVAALEQNDALQFLGQKPARQFDLVFLDPPFQSKLLQPAIRLLEGNGWLAQNAFIYVEQASKQAAMTMPAHWKPVKQAVAGQCSYALYRC